MISSTATVADINEKTAEAIDYISYDDKDELEKLERLTKYLHEVQGLLNRFYYG